MENKQTICQLLGIKVKMGSPFTIIHNGKEVYREYFKGFYERREYDSNGNVTYYEDSDGFCYKKEYDLKGNQIYFENSRGYIKDNHPKELSMDEISKKFGIPVEQLKIKKD